MNKFLTLIVCCLLSFPVLGEPKISQNKILEGRYRSIVCESEAVNDELLDPYWVLFALSYVGNENKIEKPVYELYMQVISDEQLNASTGAKLLFKTMNDEIIDLSARYVSNNADKPHEVCMMFNSYEITEEQLKMFSLGIKKMRIETDTQILDKKYTKDNIGKMITDQYKLIKSASKKKPSIYDGF